MRTRVNARVGNELARKLELVRARTKKSITTLVAESLERYCDELLGSSEAPYARLAASGFIGCAEGPRDLSTTYKASLSGSLGRKA